MKLHTSTINVYKFVKNVHQALDGQTSENFLTFTSITYKYIIPIPLNRHLRQVLILNVI